MQAFLNAIIVRVQDVPSRRCASILPPLESIALLISYVRLCNYYASTHLRLHFLTNCLSILSYVRVANMSVCQTKRDQLLRDEYDFERGNNQACHPPIPITTLLVRLFYHKQVIIELRSTI